jgi:hypothetical protein
MLVKIAIGVYCLIGALIVFGGINYLTASEFMPYHAEAIQADWSSLGSEQQGLILSLMKGRGASAVAVGATIVLLAAVGLRGRASFVFWSLPVLTLVHLGLSTYSTYFMHARTHGGPPLLLGPALGVLTIVAAVLSYMGRSGVSTVYLDRWKR